MAFEKGKEGGSQSNEDELVARIFSSIGEGRKLFIEFGAGDGRQNNTIALLLRGWSGTWYEPHRRRRLSAIERWQGYPVEIMRRRITPRNVNRLVIGELDFLSIDIDGGDFDVWDALAARPRVVCIEYGAQPASRPDAPKVTLEGMRELGHEKGYFLWGVSDSKVNAFFVRANEGKHE